MEISISKYSIGDIIKLTSDESVKKRIVLICEPGTFYDETGCSKEIYYYVINIDTNNYPPCPIKESSINKYYTKV